MDSQAIQKHILYKIELALKGRSWNWLAGKSGISQSTLQTQKGSPDREGPRFSLETLLAVARALGRAPEWFLPDSGPEDETEAERDVALMAYQRIESIVDWARAVKHGEADRAKDLQESVAPILDAAVDAEPTPKRSPRSSKSRQPSPDKAPHRGTRDKRGRSGESRRGDNG